MKKIVLLLLTSLYIFAYDATIEVVKKMESLPTIGLEDGAPNPHSKRFFKMLIGDLKVSAHFRVEDSYIVSNFDSNRADYTYIKK